uniref:Kynureninase n=1 Tax=Ciona savignyi TaxID=51511 RepID=H2Z2U0_CIOSA
MAETVFKYEGSTPEQVLAELAAKCGLLLTEVGFYQYLDSQDELAHFRDQFSFPKLTTSPGVECDDAENENCVYFCGNSLGLQPKSTKEHVQKVLENWEINNISCHVMGHLPGITCDNYVRDGMANLVGSSQEEVVVMNGLSVNLHLLMVSFYQPTKKRHKILLEEHAFPSDHYIVMSQIQQRGFDPEDSMLFVKARPDEELIHIDDILDLIEKEGDSIALIMLPGVQYFTGQVFNMEEITAAGHRKGCYVGFDLAHAVGNIELYLNKWEVDFACWCTYKYLNSGPGCLGGAFVHKKFAKTKMPKFLGWWSHKESTRFEMSNDLDFSCGVESYRISNPPPPLLVACILASEIFDQTSVRQLREKSFLLTGYLECLLKHYFSDISDSTTATVEILTPANFSDRGCQLSLRFSCSLKEVAEKMTKKGMIFDIRQPNVMRVAPVPLYCSFHDVYRFVNALREALST